MTDNENQLLEIIRESGDPCQTVLTAIKVFAAFLEQPEAGQEPPADGLQESA
jgi:hypothetical protein